MSIEDAIPGVGQVKAGLAVAKVLLPVLGALAAVGAVGGAIAYVHHLQSDRDKARAEAVQQHAAAVQQTGQAAAAGQAAQIVAQGVQQHDVNIRIHQDNEHAIRDAPGAGQALDFRLNRAGRRGLCHYAAYDGNPECARLLEPGPDAGTPAGDGGGPPAR